MLLQSRAAQDTTSVTWHPGLMIVADGTEPSRRRLYTKLIVAIAMTLVMEIYVQLRRIPPSSVRNGQRGGKESAKEEISALFVSLRCRFSLATGITNDSGQVRSDNWPCGRSVSATLITPPLATGLFSPNRRCVRSSQLVRAML